MLSILILFAFHSAYATINSPSAVEVAYSYEAEFQTASSAPTEELISNHAKFLYGYLQNESIVESFGLNENIEGVGGPKWPPSELTVLSVRLNGQQRVIRYRTSGRLLLYKAVALRALAAGTWDITLPFDLDHFYDSKCTAPDNQEEKDFWYTYDPFKEGCAYLSQEPLARTVTLHLKEEPEPATLKANLRELQGDGQKNYLITTIDGFDSDLMAPDDSGRLSFQAINEWLLAKGFQKTILTEQKDLSIYQFDKTITRNDGVKIPVRILRFLGEVEIAEEDSGAFAHFLITAIHDADVIQYVGHSGYGMNLKIESLEARAHEKVVFDNSKRQIFFFDSCSSYSYFLPVFMAAKAPGTLDLVSNGLQSIMELAVPVAQNFLGQMLEVDQPDQSWNDILAATESALNGGTFLMNVSRAD